MRILLKGFIIHLIVFSMLVLSACGGSNQSGNTANSNKDNIRNEESPIKERTIRAGIGYPEEHPQGQAMIKFKEIVEEKSGGKLKVENYFNASLGDDLKMISALQAGVQEVAGPASAPITGIVKEFGILDFPYLFNNEEEADAILDGPIGQKLLEKLPEHGLVGLALSRPECN